MAVQMDDKGRAGSWPQSACPRRPPLWGGGGTFTGCGWLQERASYGRLCRVKRSTYVCMSPLHVCCSNTAGRPCVDLFFGWCAGHAIPQIRPAKKEYFQGCAWNSDCYPLTYTIRCCCCCCNFVRLSSCGSLQPYVKFAVPGRFAVYGLCRCCGRVACASCSTGVDKGC